MVGDFGWEHEGTECQVDTVNVEKQGWDFLPFVAKQPKGNKDFPMTAKP